MKRLLTVLLAALAAFCAAGAANAQEARGDLCYVYVLDVAKGQKAFDEYTGDPEQLKKGQADWQVIFPEFRTILGEEELTTKSYRFPGSRRLFITASIFYTDESMASAAGNGSMLLGVVVSDKAHPDALSVENNAVAEVTSDSADTTRAKKHIRVNGRLYVVGLQCNRKPLPAEEP